jgi:hypothetical protein
VPLAYFEADGALASGQLTVAGSLTSATFSKTFTAVDSVSGASREFTVNVNWVSTLDLDTHTSSAHVHQLCSGELAANLEQHFREADASGSISSGGTTTILHPESGYTSTGTNTVVTVFPLSEELCHRLETAFVAPQNRSCLPRKFSRAALRTAGGRTRVGPRAHDLTLVVRSPPRQCRGTQ